MKSFGIPVLIAAVVVGATSGAVAGFLTGTSTSAESRAPGGLPTGPGLSAQVLDEIKALRRENRDLLERVAGLEHRPAPIETTPFAAKDAAMREELARLTKKVAELAARPQERTGPLLAENSLAFEPSPAFAATVEKTLQTIRKREKADGWRGGVKKAQENLDNQLARMRKDLNLTDHQVDELRTAFTKHHERDLALIQLWEAGNTPRREVGEIKRTNHEQQQQALANILTPAQLQLHQAAQGRGGKDLR